MADDGHPCLNTLLQWSMTIPDSVLVGICRGWQGNGALRRVLVPLRTLVSGFVVVNVAGRWRSLVCSVLEKTLKNIREFYNILTLDLEVDF